MPKYVYVGDDERVYPDLAVVAAPGDEHTLERLPDDGRWQTKATAEKSDKTEKGN